uniref:non-specific serine/threonine protein kinase n=1 Tax=Tetradesmus obliquus TaxID=3088 RepID=A0A383WQD5_TETOB|eukprot:jgi/Sobl393_1/20083/SZX79156.1
MAQAEADLTSKYEVRQQIGKGSFGSAFLVTNKHDKKDYVLKRVRLAKQTKWQRNSTLQERDLVSTLQHPFIVPCVESWMVQGHTVNMIYGYCEKGDLSSYLQRVQRMRGQVEEPLMMKWLCQLLLALDYLQTMRVLHRDIKTSNLLLTCDMDVQLGDFGLATHMQDAGDGSKPEDTNLVGTPHYMSPELLSCKDYGFKTDVWSLGCVFYELTAQRPTFNAFNIHGLVSKIRKNKLAPLPDSYSEAWREVIHLMLCKNPERRPSVQDLMGLPVLRPTLLEARARAQQIVPGVKLPPLLDPTPLVRLPRVCGGEFAAGLDCSSSSLSSSADRDCLDAVRGRAGDDDGCDNSWGGSTGAVQESELSELWRLSSVQQDCKQLHALELQQQQQQPGQEGQGQQLQEDEQAEECDSECMTDNHGSRCSSSRVSSSRASSMGGSLRAHSPVGALDSCKRAQQRHNVRQPGISRRSPAERVAAAIAAARHTEPAAETAQDPAAAAAVETALPPQQQHTSDPGIAPANICSAAAAGSGCPVPPLGLYRKSATAGGTATAAGTRPRSGAARATPGRPGVAASPRPAWNGGPGPSSAGGAGMLTRQRSASSRQAAGAQDTQSLKAAAAAAAGKVAAGGGSSNSSSSSSKAAKVHGAGSAPGSNYLQYLEEQRKPRQQPQQQVDAAQGAAAAVVHQHAVLDSSVQQLLHTSQELSRKTMQLQQGMQQQPRASRLASPAQQQQQQRRQEPSDDGCKRTAPNDGCVQPTPQSQEGGPSAAQLPEQSPPPAAVFSIKAAAAGNGVGGSYGDSEDEDDSSSPDESVVKQRLRFGSASPAASLAGRLSDASGTPVAQGPTPDAVTPEASTPDMFAAARAAATCFKGGQGTAEEESPLLWGAPAAAGRQSSSTDRQDCKQQGTSGHAAMGSTALAGDSPTCSLDAAAPVTGRVQGRGKDAAADAGLALSQPAEGGDGPLQASSSISLQPLGSSERQRLELLESVMQVMSGLYARGRWQELGSVLSSPGLLQDSMQAAVLAAASQLPSSQRCSPASHAAQPGSRRAGAGSRTSSGQLAGAAQPAEVQQQPALKLGDVVVLGKSKAVKGKIRYIGPVAWGAAGEDWVGMELDSACGMDGTLHGITYIDCAPRCASFHKASQLTSM